MLARLLLAQNTSSGNAARGYRQLKRELPTWAAVLAADEAAIERCIAVCGLGRQRARRFKLILQQVRRDFGRLTLAPLGRWPMVEAEAYLRSLPGVGEHTAACMLLFAFDASTVPVDKGVRRMAIRLGLAPRDATASDVRRRLDEATAADPTAAYPLHVLMFRHAKDVCQREPRCRACFLAADCPRPHGEKRRAAKRPGDGIGREVRSRGSARTCSTWCCGYREPATWSRSDSRSTTCCRSGRYLLPCLSKPTSTRGSPPDRPRQIGCRCRSGMIWPCSAPAAARCSSAAIR